MLRRRLPLSATARTLLQTGQYSTQIFSLAVLLSSLFVFNQMGGIDEAALDRCAAPRMLRCTLSTPWAAAMLLP